MVVSGGSGPLNVVILARSFDVGGAERQLVSLAVGLHRRGDRVLVLSMDWGGPLRAELEQEGVSLTSLGMRSRWDARAVVRAAKVIKGRHADVVYSFLPTANILAALLRVLHREVVVVFSVRASRLDLRRLDWFTRLTLRVEARLSRLANCVVSNSAAGASAARQRGFPANRIVVVANGIDTDRFTIDPTSRGKLRERLSVPPSDRLIGLVARLDPMKGHDLFIQAAAQIGKDAKVSFVCVGGGPDPYREQLQRQAERLGVSARISWLGGAEFAAMPQVFNGLDVLCSASRYGEGSSNSIGEAMACGVPCVVTDVGDSARLVGEVGEVVPAEDPEALARAMLLLIERLDNDRDLPHRVRQHVVDNLGVDQMVEATRSILRDLSQDAVASR